ncbi:hypothetical protein QDD76_004922 [Burkholderia cepacia]|uniref:Twin-arginine translocation pathway signal protein n=1 Tax=Burkholderia contaminans TaxID=488447 RepID=A0ABD7YHM9_9BURK|nr:MULTISPECIES: hypothetical protein [Burkholderia]EKS9798929.1 hypothetical protein [Burkholderia cepacia]EKS9805883.1 hypothetical protein [Burkholderia cepacia]EKS9813431.1 hypothetical protein [Burkholderia cepacia]EKS9820270.1 hypothetical protein [Burkholderia cepacia]EKS9828135.1 hypothetical protein [Burkholderia cepacia]
MHSHPSDRRIASRSTLPRLIALILALGATGTSAWISIVAGIERGGTSAERAAWAAVALVVLLAAHLLPALTRGEPLLIKLPALALWGVCLVGTGYGHATFFLAAQQHAGAQRAGAVEPVQPGALPPVGSGRARDVVARDQARVTELLANARAEQCVSRCAPLRARREALAAQLAALGVEADMAHRREQVADRAEAVRQLVRARQDKARIDPVTSRVAQIFALSRDGVDLAIALLFGLLLECVACLGWLQGLPRRAATPVIESHDDKVTRDSSVMPSHIAVVSGHERAESPATVEVASHDAPALSSISAPAADDLPVPESLVTVIESEALALANAIAAGQVRLTVADIRRHVRCSQAKAAQLRRAVLAMLDPIPHRDSAPSSALRTTPSRPRLVHSASPSRAA